MSLDEVFAIDLDEERSRRASEREVKEESLPIRFGGQVVATVPTELPLDVLSPLRRMDSEITLILRSVMTLANASNEAKQRWDATELIVDVLAANPALPSTVIEVIEDMARRLFGDDGYEALVAQRPTRDDLAFLTRRLLNFYGLTLGESRPASPSSTEEEASGGETSKPTSLTTTASTSEESGAAPATPASSEPDGSSS